MLPLGMGGAIAFFAEKAMLQSVYVSNVNATAWYKVVKLVGCIRKRSEKGLEIQLVANRRGVRDRDFGIDWWFFYIGTSML